MVEGARLESVYALTRIEGSNPSLSANYLDACVRDWFLVFSMYLRIYLDRELF